MTPVFQGIIKDGRPKMTPQGKQLFEVWLGSLEGKEVDIIVRRHKKPRTNRQNAYYWVVMTFAGKELGYTPEELHDAFKAMFLMDRSKKIPVPRSTTNLSTGDFMEYMDKVISKLAEIGISVPMPDDYYSSVSFIN